ncbi:MAG TPA: glycoside hydrolase family 3 N-terminal domain-containing protein [Polyangiales bacterium]|nr:glycoside hydrolase family 3 N-terminal domain-containing protein [Polyangiales bacterium]
MLLNSTPHAGRDAGAQIAAVLRSACAGLCLCALTCFVTRAQAQDHVGTLLARMTLEEKLGQLSQWSAGLAATGPAAASGSEEDIRAGKVGSFLGLWGADTTRRLQKIAVDETRLHIPLLFSFDVIHGLRTIFPVPLAEAASWNPELAEQTARAAAVEATAYGIHWTYAPMVDVARDPRWGRVVEGAGEDPYLGAAFAAARVRGFQGGQSADGSRMLATAKHFIAYGAAESGRDYNVADISERSLHEVYAPPFRAAIEAGVSSVMTAFNEVAGVPMHAHAELVRDSLRKSWGFPGVVVSDYTGIKELMVHGVAADRARAGELAMRATIDVDMISGIYGNEMIDLVKRGVIPMSLVDAAVRRVLEAKQQLGLFDDPYRYCDAAREKERTLTAESRALARTAAREAIVLLKNEGDVLPLSKSIESIAVVGALANDKRAPLGSWNANGQPDDSVTVLDGIRAAVSPSTKVVYAQGAAPTSTDRGGFAAAESAARDADVVIAVFGEIADMTGEAHSRTGLLLPGAQQALLERLHATGKPVVLVLMNGRPLALGWADKHLPAIVESFYLGVEMGHGLADVLFGDVSPSGKLPITFPRNVGQIPIYYAQKRTGRPASLTDPYTSRYLDVPWTPLYPFGHGLSYTQFQYSTPQLSAAKIAPTAKLSVRVAVKNVGKRAGTEIVQLYLRDDVASVTRPIKQLRGFQRVQLQPGQTRELTFVLDQDDFALFKDARGTQRIIEAGSFVVMTGGSSEALQSASFEITQSTTLQGLGPAIPRELRAAPKK